MLNPTLDPSTLGRIEPWDELKNSRRFYHGTNWKFDRFDLSFAGSTDDGYYGVGIYLTPDNEWARDFGTIVLEVEPLIERPFELPSSGSSDHISLIELRQRLATLQGVDPSIGAITELPDGYQVEEREIDCIYTGKPRTVYHVAPKPELYGTDKETYGPDEENPLRAIVAFNDEIRDITPFRGWAPTVLKRIGRKNFHKLLQKNGYDGIRVFDPDSGITHEIVIFDPDKARIKKREVSLLKTA